MSQDECIETHYADREGPLLGAQPLYIACCGCLQFDQTCNSQYLGVA